MLVRKIIRELEKVKSHRKPSRQLISYATRLEGIIHVAFYSFSFIETLEKLSERHKAVLDYDIKKRMREYDELTQKAATRAAWVLVRNSMQQLAIDTSELDLSQRFQQAVKTLRQILDTQRRVIASEVVVLHEIRSKVRPTATTIDGLVLVLRDSQKSINDSLREESDLVQKPINALLRNSRREYRLARRAERRSCITPRMIKKDVQTFTSPAEYQRYQQVLLAHQEKLTPRAKKLLRRGAFTAASATDKVKSLLHFFKDVAFVDKLTSLFTRRWLEHEAQMLIHRYERKEISGFSVFFLDIDHFKKINDIYGHIVGDKVLTAVAASIRNAVRKTDMVSRWGGEEFIVLAPQKVELQNIAEKLREGTFKLAEKIRSAVERDSLAYMEEINKKSVPSELHTILNNVTVSMGAGVYPLDGRTFDEVFKPVDTALNAAKAAGRNCIISAAEFNKTTL